MRHGGSRNLPQGQRVAFRRGADATTTDLRPVAVVGGQVIEPHPLLSDEHEDTSPHDGATGDLIYHDGSLWTRLPAGSAGRLLRVSAGVPAWQTLAHSELTGIGANDHHNQAHSLTGADHTASGLTAGHVLTATGATTFGFQAPGVGSAKFYAGPWTRNQLQNAGTSYGQMAFANNAGIDGFKQGLVMPYSGKLWAVAVRLSAAIPVASIDEYWVVVYQNGSATALEASLADSDQQAYDTDGSGIAFSAGDYIQVYDKRVNGGARTEEAIVYVVASFD